MKKINFYIGSNNKTKELEKEKAIEILADSYEGMSISELIGYWRGSQEKTLLVSVVCEKVDYTLLKETAKKINKELEQEAVMIEVLNSNTIFIDER